MRVAVLPVQMQISIKNIHILKARATIILEIVRQTLPIAYIGHRQHKPFKLAKTHIQILKPFPKIHFIL